MLLFSKYALNVFIIRDRKNIIEKINLLYYKNLYFNAVLLACLFIINPQNTVSILSVNVFNQNELK